MGYRAIPIVLLGALAAAPAGCARDSVRVALHVPTGAVVRGEMTGESLHVHNDGPGRARVTLSQGAGRATGRAILGVPGDFRIDLEAGETDVTIEALDGQHAALTCTIRNPGAGFGFTVQPAQPGD